MRVKDHSFYDRCGVFFSEGGTSQLEAERYAAAEMLDEIHFMLRELRASVAHPLLTVDTDEPKTSGHVLRAANELLRELRDNFRDGREVVVDALDALTIRNAADKLQAALDSKEKPPAEAEGSTQTREEKPPATLTDQCQRKLRAAGLAYPRTCKVCQLGPCHRPETPGRGQREEPPALFSRCCVACGADRDEPHVAGCPHG